MNNVISAVLYAGLITYGVHGIKNDKDFNITLNKKELIWLAIKAVISFPVIMNTNIVMSIFLIICMSYMQIAAITDKKTQLVSFGYIYILVPLSVICESITLKHFSCFALVMLLLAAAVYFVNGYNSGDILFSYLIGNCCYLKLISTLTTAAIESAIMYWCLVLFVAAIMMVTINAKEGNLKKGINLKTPKAFCPYMLCAAYVVTITLWGINILIKRFLL